MTPSLLELLVAAKNDDSVKEAPAYRRGFLDGFYKTNEGGDGAKPILGRFTMFCRIFLSLMIFCNFGDNRPTDQQTDRPRYKSS